MTFLTLVLIAVIFLAVIGLGWHDYGLVYAWPAGTTEADKEAILSARSIDDLPLEQYSIAIDRVDEFFNAYVPDTKEWQDLLD